MEGAAYPAAVWSGADLGFRWANRRFLEMLWEAGSRFDLLGMPMAGFLSDTSAAIKFQDASYTGESCTDPAYPYVTPDGAQTYWRLTLLPVPSRLGDPYDVLVTAVDVTTSVLAERSAHRQREELAAAEGLIQRTVLSTLDAEEILQRTLVEATEVYGADWGWIALHEIDSWVLRNVHGWPVETLGRSFRDTETSLPRLAAESCSVIVAPCPQELDQRGRELMARHDIGAFILVPLFGRGEVQGVMGFCWSDPEPLEEAHRELGEKLSLAVTLGLENARAYGAERTTARTLQSAFFALPRSFEGLEVSHLYHSATGGSRVGGDFYDVVETAPGRVGMLIGDVSGHGVECSALAALVKSAMHVHALEAGPPCRVLSATNELVLKSLTGGSYASAFFGVLDTTTGSLAYCSAGHPEPLLIPARRKPKLLTTSQLVLGVESKVRYANSKATLDLGDTLVLYTDGLIEARDKHGAQFGSERLLESARRAVDAPLSHVPEMLFMDAFSFAEGTLADDVAILALRRPEPGERSEELALQTA